MEYVFKLVGNYRRPVISLSAYGGIYALIDTGARFPIWTLSETELKAIGGIKQNIEVSYGGFGGKTKGELYLIDLWLEGKAVLFKNLPIVVNAKVNIRCPVILSATCFDGMIYEVNTISRHFKISHPVNGVLVKNFGYNILGGNNLDIFAQG